LFFSIQCVVTARLKPSPFKTGNLHKSILRFLCLIIGKLTRFFFGPDPRGAIGADELIPSLHFKAILAWLNRLRKKGNEG
jgi:hypothetical protein